MAHLSSLSLSSVAKSFMQAERAMCVLAGANYTFNQGVSYALTGVSGIGKSTLLHLLAGIDSPDAGTISFNGLAYTDMHDIHLFFQKHIGLIFQTPYLIPELSVVENVMIKGLIAGMSLRNAQQKAFYLLESVGLADRAESSCKILSGGEQQRVAIARALFTEPSFIVADEPTAHVDQKTGASIIRLLISCKERWGAGLVIASHDPDVARSMDVIVTLEGGVLQEKALTLERAPEFFNERAHHGAAS